MNVARQDHVAVLLRNGKVLVAGGTTAGTSTASAETYDPSTKTWSSVASMTSPRSDFAACLMPDGRVLVSGGSGISGALATAEIYDPTTNGWTLAVNLSVARQDHQMTCLPDGRVLVTGGMQGINALSSAEIFNVTTNSWSAAVDMPFAAYAHRAVALADGSVMVVGGYNSTGALANAALWTPSTGTWAVMGTQYAHAWHTVHLLSDGRVLAAGGGNGFGGAINGAEIYDPTSKNWTLAANLNTARLSAAKAAAGCLDRSSSAAPMLFKVRSLRPNRTIRWPTRGRSRPRRSARRTRRRRRSPPPPCSRPAVAEPDDGRGALRNLLQPIRPERHRLRRRQRLHRGRFLPERRLRFRLPAGVQCDSWGRRPHGAEREDQRLGLQPHRAGRAPHLRAHAQKRHREPRVGRQRRLGVRPSQRDV